MRARRMQMISIAAVLCGLAAAGAAGAVVLAADEGGTEPTPAAPAATATVALATATPTAEPTIRLAGPPPIPEALREPRVVPSVDPGGTTFSAGLGTKVDATPVRVFTGDGDCLNVRPQPGTTFEAAPFSCVPEGTLLWLSGDEVEASGEQWRYALGAGWVAIGYTKAVGSPDVRQPGEAVTLWEVGQYRDPKQGEAAGGAEVHVVRIEAATGALLTRAVFPGYGGGLGSRNPEVSPDGQHIAFSRSDQFGRPTTMVGRIADGTAMEVPGHPEGWSVDGLLLLVANQSCETVCKYDLATYEPNTGTFETIAPGIGGGLAGWAADGQSVYLASNDLVLSEVLLSGEVTARGTMSEEAGLWSAAPSPDGRYLLGTARIDSLSLVTVATAEVRRLARAPQRELPGKCGGTWSRVTGWLGASTAFYHERSSANGQDGITLIDIESGTRRVLPFFNAQDISSPAAGTLSFASWSYNANGAASAVTFVLDASTGDYVPTFVGAGAVWR